MVVPHAGTWIEITITKVPRSEMRVVPHAGTWIEIQGVACYNFLRGSFPTRERGLKYGSPCQDMSIAGVVPHAGTWIEIQKSLKSQVQTSRRSPRGNVD